MCIATQGSLCLPVNDTLCDLAMLSPEMDAMPALFTLAGNIASILMEIINIFQTVKKQVYLPK